MPVKKSSFTWIEIKAGLMVLASVVVLGLFLAVLKGIHPPENVATYHAYFTDTLGLNKGADVRYGGAKVGRVTAIELDPEDQSRIVVRFQVRPEVPVNEKSVAHVGQITLTAEKHLEISTGSKGAQRKPVDSTIEARQKDLFGLASEVGTKVGDVLDRVKSVLGVEEYADSPEEARAAGKKEVVSVPEILENVDGAVTDVRAVLSDNRENVDQIVAKVQDIQNSAQELVDQLNTLIAENRPDIRSAIEGVHEAVGSVEASADEVRAILEDVAKATARLDELTDSLEATLANAEGLSGEAQDMLTKNRPEIEELILDVRETVRHVKEFARIISERPESVILGQKPQGRRN